MDFGEGVGLVLHQNSDRRREDHDVVVVGDVDSDAGEVLLPGVVAGDDVLSDEGVADVSIVATFDEDTVDIETRNVAIFDRCSNRINDWNPAAAEIGVQEEVLRCNVLVRYWRIGRRLELDQVAVGWEII